MDGNSIDCFSNNDDLNLGVLGFVSPIKVSQVKGNGYFLRSYFKESSVGLHVNDGMLHLGTPLKYDSKDFGGMCSSGGQFGVLRAMNAPSKGSS